ncbi:hypothetical protein BDV96DRAFT_100246 [Lophiotrema nucula]|uniref:Uncharacterized protein n=1 Tax=Lophiotrema nucula TaxID=690887 RepID=A0A6A5Z4V4_9PLEO|nr:hypothetical protein BDV96DRAFT_100246 [Lophiotrema nucula]
MTVHPPQSQSQSQSPQQQQQQVSVLFLVSLGYLYFFILYFLSPSEECLCFSWSTVVAAWGCATMAGSVGYAGWPSCLARPSRVFGFDIASGNSENHVLV